MPYRLEVQFTKADDYGIVEVSLGGKKIGERFDGFNHEVIPSGKVSFGTVELDTTTKLLRFTVVDKNPQSKNYHIGVDCIKLQPVDSNDE